MGGALLALNAPRRPSRATAAATTKAALAAAGETESLASKLIARQEAEAVAKRLIAEREGAPRPPRVEDVTVEKAIEFAALHEERQAERLEELAMQPQEFNDAAAARSAMQRRSSFADNNDGEQPYGGQ